MPGPEHTPPLLRRCVAKVAAQYDGDTSKAFAICTAQYQRHGYMKKGSQELTKKGKRQQRRKAAEPGHARAMDDYETLLKTARAESMMLVLRKLLVELKRTHRKLARLRWH